MPPANKAALPVITFEHDVSVHLNGEDIRALHYPAGHTDGDAIIFFPKANVVHMGDDYVRYGFPFIDVQAGDVEGMIKACEDSDEKLPAGRQNHSGARRGVERGGGARIVECSKTLPR